MPTLAIICIPKGPGVPVYRTLYNCICVGGFGSTTQAVERLRNSINIQTLLLGTRLENDFRWDCWKTERYPSIWDMEGKILKIKWIGTFSTFPLYPRHQSSTLCVFEYFFIIVSYFPKLMIF